MRRQLLVIASTTLLPGSSRRQNVAVQLAIEKLQDLSNSSTGTEFAMDDARFIHSEHAEFADLFLDNSSSNSSFISRGSHDSAFTEIFEDSRGSAKNSSIRADVSRSTSVIAEANEVNMPASEHLTRLSFESGLRNDLGNASHIDFAELSYGSFIAVRQKISKLSGTFWKVLDGMDSKQLCYGLAGGLVLGWCCCCALHSILQNKVDGRDFDSDWSPMASKGSKLKTTFVDPARKMKQKAGDALRMAKPSGMHLHGIHGMHLRSHQSDGDRHSRDDDDSMNRYGSR